MAYSLVPTTIDANLKRDISVELSEWAWNLPLKPVKIGGEVFDRRQGRLRNGRYRLDSGFWGPTDLDLDLDGAVLRVPAGRGEGVPCPEGPWKQWASPLWPRQRCTVHLEARSRLFSRSPGARIWGGDFETAWMGGWAIGTAYPGKNFEGQHGVSVQDDDCTIDTTNIEIAWAFGDGVCIQGHAHSASIFGVPNVANAYNEAGGAVRNNVWVPSRFAVPGIHHTGRQGVSQAGGSDLLMRGVTMYQNHRSWIDFEPGAGGTFDTAVIEDCIIGAFQNLWIAAAGNGYVHRVTARRNYSVHRPLSIVARHAPGTGRRLQWSVTDNEAAPKARSGSPLPVMRFDGYDGVEVARNLQYVNWKNAGDKGAEFYDCAKVVAPDLDKQFIV